MPFDILPENKSQTSTTKSHYNDNADTERRSGAIYVQFTTDGAKRMRPDKFQLNRQARVNSAVPTNFQLYTNNTGSRIKNGDDW